MKKELKNILKIANVYIAGIMGAGFASGREIVQFFTTYYKGGFYGIVLAGILFSLIGALILDKVYTGGIKDSSSYFLSVFGKPAGNLFRTASVLFMLSIFYIMASGSVHILTDVAGLPFLYAALITASVYFLILSGGMKFILSFSSIVGPVLLMGMMLTGLFIIFFRDMAAASIFDCCKALTDNWVFSTLLYVGYNSLISVGVMGSLLPCLGNRITGIAGGALGGISLCIGTIVLNCTVYIFSSEALTKEIPMIYITERYSHVLASAYSFILWLAMLASAGTSGYGFLEALSGRTGIKRKVAAAILCTLIIPFSWSGFSRLIALLYPPFGYLGILMVLIITVRGIESMLMEFSGR